MGKCMSKNRLPPPQQSVAVIKEPDHAQYLDAKDCEKKRDMAAYIKRQAEESGSGFHATCLKFYREKYLQDSEKVVKILVDLYNEGSTSYEVELEHIPEGMHSQKINRVLERIVTNKSFVKDIRETYGKNFYLSICSKAKADADKDPMEEPAMTPPTKIIYYIALVWSDYGNDSEYYSYDYSNEHSNE
jgi:hypothetical protein